MTTPKPRGGRRDGAGRPKLMAEPVYIGVRLDRPDYERMVAAAEIADVTLSELVRSVVVEWLMGMAMPVKRGRKK